MEEHSDLEEQIALKVMGWREAEGYWYDGEDKCIKVADWHPKTDANQALKVATRMFFQGWSTDIYGTDGTIRLTKFVPGQGSYHVQERFKRLNEIPEAICNASFKAINYVSPSIQAGATRGEDDANHDVIKQLLASRPEPIPCPRCEGLSPNAYCGAKGEGDAR